MDWQRRASLLLRAGGRRQLPRQRGGIKPPLRGPEARPLDLVVVTA
jgi:hypothetical protein